MKTARPRNLAVLLGSALALLSYYPPPSDGGSAFIYRATAPLHPPTPTPRTSPAAAGSEATGPGPGPGRRGSSCFCRGGGDAAEHRLFRRLRRSRARAATASNRNCGGGGGRPPSFVGRFRPDPGMQISVFALEDRFAEPGGDNDNVEEGREPSPQNQSPPTFSTPPDSSSPFVSPADAHHPPYTSASASASSPQAAVRPNYSSFAGRTSVMRESAVVVDWDPVSELERRVDHGASYEHWPEYATNVHRVWERRREGGDVAAGRGDRGPPVGGIGGDGGQPSGCTYDADADDDDDVAVPVTRGVFCGFRVTAEERRRLRSASDDDDDVNAERDYEI